MVTIYVLRLTSNKYYVGKTHDIIQRIEDHIAKLGSEWTKKYPPIDLIHIYEDCDDYDEDKYTLKAMAEHGIDNVRGGSFVQMILSPEEKETILKMINNSNNNCFKCGSNNHFVKDCHTNKTENESNNHFVKNYQTNKITYVSTTNKCYRCGRSGHHIADCYAKTHANEYEFDDEPTETQYNKCYRCGRSGHYVSECYAKYHI